VFDANLYIATLRLVFAAGDYAGPKSGGALQKTGRWAVQIVKRSNTAQGS